MKLNKPAAGRARKPEIQAREALPDSVLPYEAREGTSPLKETVAAAAAARPPATKTTQKYIFYSNSSN